MIEIALGYVVLAFALSVAGGLVGYAAGSFAGEAVLGMLWAGVFAFRMFRAREWDGGLSAEPSQTDPAEFFDPARKAFFRTALTAVAGGFIAAVAAGVVLGLIGVHIFLIDLALFLAAGTVVWRRLNGLARRERAATIATDDAKPAADQPAG